MKYFIINEFVCKETGENDMDDDFLDLLDTLRENCGFPFWITSGFRSVLHSKEKGKTSIGTHPQGIASDIRVSNGSQRYKIINEALKLGFTGIGVAKTFIHVDTRKGPAVIWVY